MLNTPCSSVMDKEKDMELRTDQRQNWQSLIEYLQGKGKRVSGVIPRFLTLLGLVFKCSFHTFPSHHHFSHPIPRHFFPCILGIIIVPYPNHFFKHVFHCIISPHIFPKEPNLLHANQDLKDFCNFKFWTLSVLSSSYSTECHYNINIQRNCQQFDGVQFFGTPLTVAGQVLFGC